MKKTETSKIVFYTYNEVSTFSEITKYFTVKN
jgi:hypothetical protein